MANDATSPNMGGVAPPQSNRGGHPRRARTGSRRSRTSLLDGTEGSSISTRDLLPGDLCNAIRAVIRIVKGQIKCWFNVKQIASPAAALKYLVGRNPRGFDNPRRSVFRMIRQRRRMRNPTSPLMVGGRPRLPTNHVAHEDVRHARHLPAD